jgi:hypothetical protein
MQVKSVSHSTHSVPHGSAVALGANVQALDIEHTSVVVDGVPTRRPSPRVQLVPVGKFAARDGRPSGMKVTVVDANGLSVERTVTAKNWALDNKGGLELMLKLARRVERIHIHHHQARAQDAE